MWFFFFFFLVRFFFTSPEAAWKFSVSFLLGLSDSCANDDRGTFIWPTFVDQTCLWDGDVAELVRASGRHAADAGSIPRCGKGFFSQSRLSVQTLLRVSVHPLVQSHALTAVRTLKIL